MRVTSSSTYKLAVTMIARSVLAFQPNKQDNMARRMVVILGMFCLLSSAFASPIIRKQGTCGWHKLQIEQNAARVEPTLNEEPVKAIPVKINVPAPPTIDNTVVLPAGYTSLSALRNAQKMNLEKVKKYRTQQKKEQEKSYNEPEIIKKEPFVAEKEVNPVVKMNVPAPPSISNEIIIPSGYPSLPALRDAEKIILEKVKENKIQHQEQQQEVKIQEQKREKQNQIESYERPEISRDEPSAIREEVEHVVRFNVPAPPLISNEIVIPKGYPSLPALRDAEKVILEKVKENKIQHQEQQQEVKSHNSVNTQEEPSVNVEEVEPVVKLNVPAPPSINNNIAIPSGYPSLPALRDTERTILEKIKENKIQQQRVDKQKEEKNIEIRNEEPSANVEEIKPDNFVSEVTREEPNMSVEEVEPVVRLNIPAPPSINSNIVIPSGFPSLPALRDSERIILEKVKENSVLKQKQDKEIEVKSYDNPESTHAKPSLVVKELKPAIKINGPTEQESEVKTCDEPETIQEESSVTMEEERPAVKLNVPSPPSINIVIPAGYPSLPAIRDAEKLILEKVKENNIQLHKQEQENKVKPYKQPQSPREESSVDVEEVKPLEQINVPSPPSISNNIVIPAGYPSIPALQDAEKLILERVKENKIWQQKPEQQKELSQNQPKINHEPSVSTVEEKPVKLNVPVPLYVNSNIVLPSVYRSVADTRDEQNQEKQKESLVPKRNEEVKIPQSEPVDSVEEVEIIVDIPARPVDIVVPSDNTLPPILQALENTLLEKVKEDKNQQEKEAVDEPCDETNPQSYKNPEITVVRPVEVPAMKLNFPQSIGNEVALPRVRVPEKSLLEEVKEEKIQQQKQEKIEDEPCEEYSSENAEKEISYVKPSVQEIPKVRFNIPTPPELPARPFRKIPLPPTLSRRTN